MEDSTVALSPFIFPFTFLFFFFFGKRQGKSVWAGLVLCCAEISNFSAPFPACLPATEVLVLIDFEATMPDELTVAAGDVVKGVSKAGEEGWLQGELGGKKGIFPANFVKVCPPR